MQNLDDYLKAHGDEPWLKESLDYLSKHSLFLTGPSGIGKSYAVYHLSRGVNVIDTDSAPFACWYTDTLKGIDGVINPMTKIPPFSDLYLWWNPEAFFETVLLIRSMLEEIDTTAVSPFLFVGVSANSDQFIRLFKGTAVLDIEPSVDPEVWFELMADRLELTPAQIKLDPVMEVPRNGIFLPSIETRFTTDLSSPAHIDQILDWVSAML